MKWLAIPGFVLSLLLRLAYPVLLNFDGLYGQDPYTYFDYSRQISRLFTTGTPLGRFYYPIGFPVLGALGSPLLMVALCGAFGCILCGAITWEAAQRLKLSARAGQIAAIAAWLILTVSPQNVQSGSVVMSDIPALGWALLAVWATLHYEREQRLRWIMLAAFGCALAAMTRFQYALIALPIGLHILLIWRGIRPKHALAAILIGLLAYAPQLVMTLRTPEIISENRIVWVPGNISAQIFVTGDGTHTYDEPNYLYYLLPVRSPYYVSVWLLPLIAIGLVIALRRKIGWFLLLWFGSQYVFLAGIPVQNIRYALIAFPPVAILIALGVGWLQTVDFTPQPSLHQWRGGVNARLVLPSLFAERGVRGVSFFFQKLPLFILMIGLIQMAQTTHSMMIGFVDNKNRELAVLRWMESHIPEQDATVYALDMIPAMQHYLPYHTVQIYYETPESINNKRSSTTAYALFNVYQMQTQWAGRPTGQVYEIIMRWVGWQSLGEVNGYTLLRLNDSMNGNN